MQLLRTTVCSQRLRVGKRPTTLGPQRIWAPPDFEWINPAQKGWDVIIIIIASSLSLIFFL